MKLDEFKDFINEKYIYPEDQELIAEYIVELKSYCFQFEIFFAKSFEIDQDLFYLKNIINENIMKFIEKIDTDVSIESDFPIEFNYTDKELQEDLQDIIEMSKELQEELQDKYPYVSSLIYFIIDKVEDYISSKEIQDMDNNNAY